VVGKPPELGVEVNVTVPVGAVLVLVLVTLAVKVTLFPFVRGFAVAPETVVLVVWPKATLHPATTVNNNTKNEDGTRTGSSRG
jgi:hypothetical protein